MYLALVCFLIKLWIHFKFRKTWQNHVPFQSKTERVSHSALTIGQLTFVNNKWTMWETIYFIVPGILLSVYTHSHIRYIYGLDNLCKGRILVTSILNLSLNYVHRVTTCTSSPLSPPTLWKALFLVQPYTIEAPFQHFLNWICSYTLVPPILYIQEACMALLESKLNFP